jgi:hypothetical protein
MAGGSGDQIPVGVQILRICPDRSGGLSSLFCNGYRVSFPGIKRPGRGVNHPLLFSTEVKERVELYLYSSSGPSWPALGQTFLFVCRPCAIIIIIIIIIIITINIIIGNFKLTT